MACNHKTHTITGRFSKCWNGRMSELMNYSSIADYIAKIYCKTHVMCTHACSNTPKEVHLSHLTPSGFTTLCCHPSAFRTPQTPKSSDAQVLRKILCGIGIQPALILLQTLNHLCITYNDHCNVSLWKLISCIT